MSELVKGGLLAYGIMGLAAAGFMAITSGDDTNALRRTLYSAAAFFFWGPLLIYFPARATARYFRQRFLGELRELLPERRAASALPRSPTELKLYD